MIELVFWSAAGVLLYTYLGYPALVWAWARIRPRPIRPRDWQPTVSVLVAAHNEEARIGGRIENLLALDYPGTHLEILVGSDGSTDATVECARRYETGTTHVMDYPTRRGKPAVLNDLARLARGEVLVMADARQTFDRRALRALVRSLGDPAVGAVSGELVLVPATAQTSVTQGVGFYWQYEKLIRRSESTVDSTVGATGAIYALRRALFDPLPEDTLLDDVVVPVRVARRGFRVVFASEALAFDRPAAERREELVRKVRTIAGTFQLFVRERWLLNPFANRLWFQTVSHKGVRLLGPFLLVILLTTNLLLAGSSLYGPLLACQAVFYGLALLGAWRGTSPGVVVSLPYVFCVLNWATALALYTLLTGRQRVAWRRGVAA